MLLPAPSGVAPALASQCDDSPERYAPLLQHCLEPGHNRFLTISIGAGKKHEWRGGDSEQFAGIVNQP